VKAESREVNDLFKPIVVEITIESEAELTMLWHRHNLSFNEVRTNSKDRLIRFDDIHTKDDSYGFFLELNKHMERLDLLKPRKEQA